jgi:hypothetical protein
LKDKIADALQQVTPEMLDNTWRNLATQYCAVSTKEAMLSCGDFPPQTPVYLLLLCKVLLKYHEYFLSYNGFSFM